LQVGVKCIETGIYGARCNVLINCDSLTDKVKKDAITTEITGIYKESQARCAQILKRLEAM